MTRRQLLRRSTGFGLTAFQGLQAGGKPAHFRSRIKSVIFAFMSGAVSSSGAWINYGLGSDNQDLPGYQEGVCVW